jgi:hypothetical protein
MPSSADRYPASRQRWWSLHPLWSSQGFWPSTIRIVILEIMVLVALAGAAVFYLNWSSEVAFAEFLAATDALSPSSSAQAVAGHVPCDRGT